MELGSRIKELRKRNGLTREKLAKIIEVSPNTLRDWENNRYGKRQLINGVVKLSKVFKVSIDDLLTGEKRGSLGVRGRKIKLKASLPDYCLINIKRFIRYMGAEHDLYAKDRSGKITKIFDKNYLYKEPFYEETGSTYYFITSDSYEQYANMIIANILRVIDDYDSTLRAHDEIFLICNELVKDLVSLVGVPSGLGAIVDMVIYNTINNIQKLSIDNWYKHLLINDDQYLFSHSLILGYFLVRAIGPSQNSGHSNVYRLCIAAFLHDITLPNSELARMTSTDDLDEVTDRLVKSHPAKASSLSRSFSSLGGVDKIIAEHHEKFDGSGFPRRLKESELSELSKIFNIGHKIVSEIFLEKRKSLSKNHILKSVNRVKKRYKDYLVIESIASIFKSFEQIV